MNSKRVLITGGAGNIGASLTRHLLKRGHEVIVVDDLKTGSLKKLPEGSDRLQFIRADVNSYSDVAPIFTSYRPQYVFHYAALVGVARTLKNPMGVLSDIDGLRNVLTLSKGTGVNRVFYASSSEVYGEPVEHPQREDTTPLNSRLPYAVVKNLGEIYFRTFYREFGLPFTIFRFFNTYGPLQSEEFVISKFVAKAIRGEDLTIFGDGSQTRTFCYVDDSIEFQSRCLEEDLFVNQTVNVGSDNEVTILELAELVKSLVNDQCKIVHLPPLAEGDMMRRRPDNRRMKEVLGRELVSLRDGILATAGFARSGNAGSPRAPVAADRQIVA
jgi:UDP-glucuronate decarboxylase